MAEGREHARWTDSTAAQLASAAFFLALAVAWLLLPGEQGWSHWLPAVGWFGVAGIWAVRAIKSTSASRARTRG